MADNATDLAVSLTPDEQTMLQQLYDNVFTRWGDLQSDGGGTILSLRTKGLAFLYGPSDLHYYAGFFEPQSPHIEDQPVACTQAGADALGQPWPIATAHRDRVWQREIDRIRKK